MVLRLSCVLREHHFPCTLGVRPRDVVKVVGDCAASGARRQVTTPRTFLLLRTLQKLLVTVQQTTRTGPRPWRSGCCMRVSCGCCATTSGRSAATRSRMQRPSWCRFCAGRARAGGPGGAGGVAAAGRRQVGLPGRALLHLQARASAGEGDIYAYGIGLSLLSCCALLQARALRSCGQLTL